MNEMTHIIEGGNVVEVIVMRSDEIVKALKLTAYPKVYVMENGTIMMETTIFHWHYNEMTGQTFFHSNGRPVKENSVISSLRYCMGRIEMTLKGEENDAI